MSQNEQNKPSSLPTSPPQFSDGEGRPWTINLTLGLIDAVQEATKLDLLSDSESSPLVSLLFDQRKLGRVLWTCIEKQARSGDVTREDFIGSLNGESLTAGWEALFDAIRFFIPPQSRKAYQAAFEAQMAAIEQGVAAIVEVAESQETNQAIREAIGRIKRDMQTDLPKALANSAMN